MTLLQKIKMALQYYLVIGLEVKKQNNKFMIVILIYFQNGKMALVRGMI